jgi:hypothetical protein
MQIKSSVSFFRKQLGYKGKSLHNGRGAYECDVEGATWPIIKERALKMIELLRANDLLVEVDLSLGDSAHDKLICVDPVAKSLPYGEQIKVVIKGPDTYYNTLYLDESRINSKTFQYFTVVM